MPVSHGVGCGSPVVHEPHRLARRERDLDRDSGPGLAVHLVTTARRFVAQVHLDRCRPSVSLLLRRHTRDIGCLGTLNGVPEANVVLRLAKVGRIEVNGVLNGGVAGGERADIFRDDHGRTNRHLQAAPWERQLRIDRHRAGAEELPDLPS